MTDDVEHRLLDFECQDDERADALRAMAAAVIAQLDDERTRVEMVSWIDLERQCAKVDRES